MNARTDISPREQAQLLAEGCDHVETVAELEARIAKKGRLTVKFGIDPTGSLLHLGHAVTLHKMAQFLELGHRVILLIGDFTAKIGDPTGRNDTRPPLTDEMIAANMHDYRAQAAKILDFERAEVMHNSSWLAKLSMAELIELMGQTTVAQMLSRNDFSQRYGDGTPIALHEFLYPIAQAYDSVAMQADVELGGSDQLFNFLLAREYQARAGQPRQICMTSPILEGTDGVVRMGKSKGNYVGITESPGEQFGKLMRLPDEMIPRYAYLAAFEPTDRVAALRAALTDGSLHPMTAKKDLAQAIVARYHGADAARVARDGFEATVQRGELPAEMPEIVGARWRSVAEALVAAGFAASKREAERLIAGNGVRVDGTAVSDPRAPWPTLPEPAVLAVGNRRFVRVLPAPNPPTT